MGSTAMTNARQSSADQYVSRLKQALELMGFEVTILEPSTRLTASVPSGRSYMSETVALLASEDDELSWHWSWGDWIDRAEEISKVATQIAEVLKATC